MTEPQSEADLRMCRVLLDQISLAPRQNTYLPTSENKLLAPILSALEKNPADNTPLAHWATQVYTTERTLSRRCQQELGMSFAQWRQRLRFLHSISLLEQGKTVQDISLNWVTARRLPLSLCFSRFPVPHRSVFVTTGKPVP